MGWLSNFKRTSGASAAAGAAMPAADAVQAARVRARRRLIGAAVLLAIGIIGFPLVFETQPRPIPVDLPIEIPAKDNTAPLQAPQAKRTVPRAALPVPESALPADLPPSAPQETADRAAPVEKSPAARGSEPLAAPLSRAPSTPAGGVPKAPVVSAPATTPIAKPVDTTADADRFVVQVAAFADVNLAHEARLKVEKLGLKTYTQVVDTPAGKRVRVRVGPFADKAQAEQAAAKIKGGGLPAAVLTL